MQALTSCELLAHPQSVSHRGTSAQPSTLALNAAFPHLSSAAARPDGTLPSADTTAINDQGHFQQPTLLGADPETVHGQPQAAAALAVEVARPPVDPPACALSQASGGQPNVFARTTAQGAASWHTIPGAAKLMKPLFMASASDIEAIPAAIEEGEKQTDATAQMPQDPRDSASDSQDSLPQIDSGNDSDSEGMSEE